METYEDIKLIACDMDGTLLDERSQVPPETFDLVCALDAAGIRFVAASGCRYDTLRAFSSRGRSHGFRCEQWRAGIRA